MASVIAANSSTFSPDPVPDNVSRPICRFLQADSDFATLLVVQKTSQAGYKAATPLIYRDMFLKNDQQIARLLSQGGLDHHSTTCRSDNGPRMHRIAQTFGHVQSVTFAEVPSEETTLMGDSVREVLSLAQQVLFPAK